MYNFNFIDNEELIEVFDEVYIRCNNKENLTTIALTDKRLLFLDYVTNDGMEVLRITKGINFMRYKDIYYQVNLDDIRIIDDGEYYKIVLKDNIIIEFNNKDLYELLERGK